MICNTFEVLLIDTNYMRLYYIFMYRETGNFFIVLTMNMCNLNPQKHAKGWVDTNLFAIIIGIIYLKNFKKLNIIQNNF